MKLAILSVLTLMLMASADKADKYSKKANQPKEDLGSIRNIEKPFRISQVNLIWSKAVHKLTESKLKSLYNELKIHDKEELAYKSTKDSDKEGFKAKELRKKLVGIMSTYGLLEYFEENNHSENYKKHKPYEGKSDIYKNKSLFKDKKLNKLWDKAQYSGFNQDQLFLLKEELEEQENKVDLYYKLLEELHVDKHSDKDHYENAVNEDELDLFNEIISSDSNDIYEEQKRQSRKHAQYLDNANTVREKNREIRDNMDRLERFAAKGPNSQDFIEPKVQGLWKIAVDGNFTAQELASLKVELLHFESRLLKLRHMNVEHALTNEKPEKNMDKVNLLEQNIKKQSRKVEKIQNEIERRLFLKHTEL